MNDEVILKPKVKEDNTVTFSIRIERDLAQKYDDLSNKANYSRNELINIALRYYMEIVKFEPEVSGRSNIEEKKVSLPKKKIPINKDK